MYDPIAVDCHGRRVSLLCETRLPDDETRRELHSHPVQSRMKTTGGARGAAWSQSPQRGSLSQRRA